MYLIETFILYPGLRADARGAGVRPEVRPNLVARMHHAFDQNETGADGMSAPVREIDCRSIAYYFTSSMLMTSTVPSPAS